MFRQLFDAESSTYTYLLADDTTRRAVLIDPVRGQLDRDLTLLKELNLTLVWVLDTHVHADHITAAHALRERTGCQVAYPNHSGARGLDRSLEHGDVVEVDGVRLEVRLTPGHTSGSASYVQLGEDRVFTGDTLLIRGCGRTDFQEGDAHALYRSVHEQLFTLPDRTLVYPGHDYKGRTASSIGEERAHNPRLGGGRSEAEFVAIMDGLHLSPPRLLDVAVPANRELGRESSPFEHLERSASGAVQAPLSWVETHAASVRLVDVREPDEYNGPLGHLPGTELVPLGTLQRAASDWDRSEPIVAICRSGGRSDRAALTLEAMGFELVASMTGGTSAWANKPSAGTCDGASA